MCVRTVPCGGGDVTSFESDAGGFEWRTLLPLAARMHRSRSSPDLHCTALRCAVECALHAPCRRGQVLLSTVNEATMVPFVSQQLNNLDLALAMARRGNLPGAEGLVAQQFERLFAAGQYKEAAEVAAESPQGILRTKEVRGFMWA